MIIMDSEIYFMDFYCKMMNPGRPYCIFDNLICPFILLARGQYRAFSAFLPEVNAECI